MERVTSRKNKTIAHLRALGADKAYRREAGAFLCDGEKLLGEALAANARIECVLWSGEPAFALDSEIMQITAPAALVSFVSPLKESAGPVFSVKMRGPEAKGKIKNAVILENVQDPGNVGTVLRTARAFGIGQVLLVGDCADIYNPKTVRSTMGAVFSQSVREIVPDALPDFLEENGLQLYGASLARGARDIRDIEGKNLAVAIGSEGRGLSDALCAMCAGQVIIPMEQGCESLNAAVAASIVMWEMYKGR